MPMGKQWHDRNAARFNNLMNMSFVDPHDGLKPLQNKNAIIAL